MDREQLKSLLVEIGVSAGRNGRFKDSGDNIMMCCPSPEHNESRPSCGIHVEKLIGNCYGCGYKFNLVQLVAQCKEIPPYKAMNWLEDKYNMEKQVITRNYGIRRYDEKVPEVEEVKRFELPKLKLAPFKSGKATHEYFYNRGFTSETVKKFMIGWDCSRMRVTMPVFWEDGVLSGFIGRAVLEEKINGEYNKEFGKVYKGNNSPKFYIYNEFPTGDILFPLNHFKSVDKTAILVEGGWDAIWLHQMGVSNVLATLTTKLAFSKTACKQANLLKKLGIKNIILMKDNDRAGEMGAESDYNILKNDFVVYSVKYPEGVKDPAQLSKEQLDKMIDEKYLYGVNRITSKLKLSRID